jgi:hypothetical protein
MVPKPQKGLLLTNPYLKENPPAEAGGFLFLCVFVILTQEESLNI